jgi:saccharopine dehydrogenase (NAD+, L-lysine-forming)
VFGFPEGIGPVECVNVEHPEVLLIPRWVEAKRVTFKYGLGDGFISKPKTLHGLGLDPTEPLTVPGGRGPATVFQRDVVAGLRRSRRGRSWTCWWTAVRRGHARKCVATGQ